MTILFFILGLFIGSFLNCLICRLKDKKSFLFGRSCCPKCGHELTWLDLVPVLSFVFLKGKCRYCSEKISWQYPLTEIATGLLYAFLYWNYGFNLFLIFVFSCLLVIFVYDLKHFIIPDEIIFPLIIISLIFLYGNFFVAIGTTFAFFLLYFFSKGKWLGFGDVKLAFFLGLFLGWPNILVGLFLSFVIGAIIGIGLIILKKKGIKSEVPFAPFLVLGAFIAFFWGQEIIFWYLNLL